MLLHQFQRLSQSTQYHHLINEGACVADRSTDNEDRLLFQICDYYVEIIFIRYTDHILGLQVFRDTQALDPYLKEISVESLFS